MYAVAFFLTPKKYISETQIHYFPEANGKRETSNFSSGSLAYDVAQKLKAQLDDITLYSRLLSVKIGNNVQFNMDLRFLSPLVFVPEVL